MVYFDFLGWLTSLPFLLIVAKLVAMKIYFKYTCGVFNSNRLMLGKTVIITGANKGLGKETALDLAARGARVILACRDLTRANDARDEIVRATANEQVLVHQLDLASFASVESFARKILETEERLDVLVNSAGVGGLGDRYTEDGFHVDVQTNYLGPFLLTNLLVDLLRKSAPSRIIFVSSMCHHHGHINLVNFNDWGKTKTLGNPLKEYIRYSSTKLANILNANHLALLLAGSGVTVNSCHPGAVITDIQKGFKLFYHPLKLFLKCFCKSPREGAQTGLYLAVSEEVEGISGQYFEDCKLAHSSADAQDKMLAERLWEETKDTIENKSRFIKVL